MDKELQLRIVVERPPAGVWLRVQRGRDGLLPPSREDADAVVFDFAVRVADAADGGMVLRGELTQGPPAARFVYVNAGKRAGQAHSCWERRAKVPLAGITPELAREALAAPGAVIEARIAGTGRDGGPACATVPLLGAGWHVVRAAE